MVTEPGTIRPVRIEDELRSSYIDYAMSVIVSRALPDVRDGLKPVQRRILFAMDELSLRPPNSSKKSARIVGDVLGRYHPHGDSPVYDAMVRMAQHFSLRYPLIIGQGNFGSIDNDPPAAMRYTEAKLSPIAVELLTNIDSDTVDFTPNFDESMKEPRILPARMPNLIVNGASGIAVGMATSIPPHNLSEICDAISYLIDHPEPAIEGMDEETVQATHERIDAALLDIVKGPDFPTGGIILGGTGREALRAAYTTGHGRVVIRGRAEIEPLGRAGREQIVITEVPYQVNKATLVEKIAQLARDRKIEGISDVRDESDRQGLRVVVELRGSADGPFVLSNLYEHTALQSAFPVNMLALVDGQPKVLTLREILQHYIEFRVEVVTRKARYDLKKAQDRIHIVEGLRVAQERLDEIIHIIRESDDTDTARDSLMAHLMLTREQIQAILDMQLRRLTALDRKRLEDEHNELQKTIGHLESLLGDPLKVRTAVKKDNEEHKNQFGDQRRTEILEEEGRKLTREEREPHFDVVVTLSRNGYIKRVPVATYRLQHRGGKGVTGMTRREDDVVRHMLAVDTHDTLLFFTDRGKVFSLKCYQTPSDASRTSRGTPVVNLIPIPKDEHVTAMVAVSDLRQNAWLVLATRLGEIKRTSLTRFANIRSSGIIAMDLEPHDELIAARPATEDSQVMIVTTKGMSVRFPVANLRDRSRTAGGVRAIRLKPEDHVISMDVVTPEARLLAVSKRGFGKLTRIDSFRKQARGGKGVIAFRVDERTGPLVAAKVVQGNEDLVVASAKALVNRTSLSEVRDLGRYARGVWIMRLDADDLISSVSTLSPSSEQDPARMSGTSAAPSTESEIHPDSVETPEPSDEEILEESDSTDQDNTNG
jgi:DNA gyrase subunit A